MKMEFNEHNASDESPTELMEIQLSQIEHIPESHKMKAMIMSIHPAIAQLVEPIVHAIEVGMESAPEEIPEPEAQAMLYHDLISTILMGLLMRVRAEMESAEIGCFHPRQSTVEETLVVQDIPESQDDLDIASMKTAEILKMMGMQDDNTN